MLGLGYPTPYLGLFREDCERCIAFMPAAQGVLKWPTARPTLATLVDEFSLPLPDAAVDRILLVHALEMSDDPEGLLREVWRVLAPSGRMIAVIPNRRGVWTRTDNTPFGHGRPYSRSQITQLLRQTWFTPTAWGEALFMPPVGERLVPALGDGVGARRRGAVAAVRRRAYRGSDQAGLSRDPRAPRAHAADPGAASRCWCRRRRHAGIEKGRARFRVARPHDSADAGRDSRAAYSFPGLKSSLGRGRCGRACRGAGRAAGGAGAGSARRRHCLRSRRGAPLTCGCGPVMKEGRRSTPPLSAITGCGWGCG